MTNEMIALIIFTVTCGVLFVIAGYQQWKIKKLNDEITGKDTYIQVINERLGTARHDRDEYKDVITDLKLKISKLEKQVKEDPGIPQVTRIEAYAPEMHVIKYSVEVWPDTFRGSMAYDDVIELAKDELYKKIFEQIKPNIEVVISQNLYYCSTVVSGGILVEKKKEAK